MITDRYPGADVLEQLRHWDPATREVILDRVHNVPAFQFFGEQERVTLEALCARVIPQEHRFPEHRVPIAPWIDQRCREEQSDGFQFDDMPDERAAWRAGLAGLDQTARALYHHAFSELNPADQDLTLRAIDEGHPPGDVWTSLPPRRWWRSLALRQISAVYYAHPYAWDEIGFGGPAYPRGYAALNHGAPEPWEPREVSDGRERHENPEDWR